MSLGLVGFLRPGEPGTLGLRDICRAWKDPMAVAHLGLTKSL